MFHEFVNLTGSKRDVRRLLVNLVRKMYKFFYLDISATKFRISSKFFL